LLHRSADAPLEKIGQEHGVSTAQLASAWVLPRGPDIVPLIGTKRNA
jgi:aryl-alcohol dehydrogenase-like predicted oxidoreductase